MTASLKMAERPDWSLFRTFDGLQQRAGVPAKWLRRLVLKEIGDNALDVSTNIRSGGLLDGHYFVEDKGPGLDGTPEQIAELYSMARPMRSSKLSRLPSAARSAMDCASSPAPCSPARASSPSPLATSGSNCDRSPTARHRSSKSSPPIIRLAPGSISVSVRRCRPMSHHSAG